MFDLESCFLKVESHIQTREEAAAVVSDPSCSCSGNIGASLIKHVNMFTVETVTNSRNAVSIIEQRDNLWHKSTLIANGIKSSARAKSTSP
jgi:hypothetical protein